MYTQLDFYFELFFLLTVTIIYLSAMVYVTKAYIKEEPRYFPEIYAEKDIKNLPKVIAQAALESQTI